SPGRRRMPRSRGRRSIRSSVAVCLCALASLIAVTSIGALAAGARAASLPPQEGTAPPPGPANLYAPPPQAPQLENASASVWHAAPIPVSGASAYRDGEFLYQGYLYDDHGAKLVPDPTDPQSKGEPDPSGGDSFSTPDGTYTYPTGPGYDGNAANLVE